MDLVIYPSNINTSIWVSLILGYILTIVSYLLQYPAWLVYKLIEQRNLSKRWKIVVDDLLYTVGHIATIAVWRGWWEFYEHFLPGPMNLKLWLSSLVSFLILTVMLTANSVLGHGVEVDGEEGVLFDLKYSRYFFDWVKARKTHVEVNINFLFNFE